MKIKNIVYMFKHPIKYSNFCGWKSERKSELKEIREKLSGESERLNRCGYNLNTLSGILLKLDKKSGEMRAELRKTGKSLKNYRNRLTNFENYLDSI